MPDPFTINELVSYSFFGRWFQILNPGATIDETMQARYDDYIKDLTARTAAPYVASQAGLAYFKDYYLRDDRHRASKEAAHIAFKEVVERGAFETFSIDAQPGQTGFTMNETVPEPSQAAGEVSRQVLTIKSIPPKVSRQAILQGITTRIEIADLSISGPDRTKLRTGWIVLQHEDVQSALKKLEGLSLHDPVFGEYKMSLGLYYLPASRRIMLWSQLNTIDQIEEHRQHVERIINKHCASINQSSIWESITASSHGIDSLSSSQMQQQLDLGVEYLRRVHHFDYWQLQQYDSIFDLETHSPGYIRTQSTESSAYAHWARQFKSKLHIVIDPDTYLTELRQPSISSTVDSAIEKHIHKEDETRFRCQVLDCTKLFKDRPFVQKHIEKRHGEWLDGIKVDAELIKAYLLDPNREVGYKVHSERRERRRSPVRRFARPYERQKSRVYRDLDAPTEDTPELNY